MKRHKTCWEILGIDVTENQREIKKAYANKAKLFHPEDDAEAFKQLRTAYEDAINFSNYQYKKNMIDLVELEPELINEEKHFDISDENKISNIIEEDLIRFDQIFIDQFFDSLKYDIFLDISEIINYEEFQLVLERRESVLYLINSLKKFLKNSRGKYVSSSFYELAELLKQKYSDDEYINTILDHLLEKYNVQKIDRKISRKRYFTKIIRIYKNIPNIKTIVLGTSLSIVMLTFTLVNANKYNFSHLRSSSFTYETHQDDNLNKLYLEIDGDLNFTVLKTTTTPNGHNSTMRFYKKEDLEIMHTSRKGIIMFFSFDESLKGKIKHEYGPSLDDDTLVFKVTTDHKEFALLDGEERIKFEEYIETKSLNVKKDKFPSYSFVQASPILGEKGSDSHYETFFDFEERYRIEKEISREIDGISNIRYYEEIDAKVYHFIGNLENGFDVSGVLDVNTNALKNISIVNKDSRINRENPDIISSIMTVRDNMSEGEFDQYNKNFEEFVRDFDKEYFTEATDALTITTNREMDGYYIHFKD